MNIRNKKVILSAWLLVIAMLACNVGDPKNSSRSNLELTITAQGMYIQQTSQAQVSPVIVTAEAAEATEPPAAIPSPTNTVAVAQATPQEPQVIKSTLCWVGPGAKYEVVSSLNTGQAVEVVGRGSIEGWFIINNPRYHDPCWMQASDLKLDASFDINALKIFNPPPLPTNTPKPTPVPSATPV